MSKILISENGVRKVKKIFKKFFYLVPNVIIEKLLIVWRKYYWWQRLRIKPQKNKKVIHEVLNSGRLVKLELGSPNRAGMQDWIASDINGGEIFSWILHSQFLFQIIRLIVYILRMFWSTFLIQSQCLICSGNVTEF